MLFAGYRSESDVYGTAATRIRHCELISPTTEATGGAGFAQTKTAASSSSAARRMTLITTMPSGGKASFTFVFGTVLVWRILRKDGTFTEERYHTPVLATAESHSVYINSYTF